MEQFKEGLGVWLGQWFAQVAPTTKAMQEYIARPAAHAMAFVPGRMIDAAEDMLTLWGRNQPGAGPTQPPKLPVVLVAVANDVTPTALARNKAISAPVHVVMPGDAKERVFQLRTMTSDYRVQLVFVAHDGDTATSLVKQFVSWIDHPSRRVVETTWKFADLQSWWPAQLETPDVMGSSIQTGQKNIVMLAVDLNFCATEPLYRAVGAGEVFRDAMGNAQHQQDGITGLEGNQPGRNVQAEGFTVVERATARHWVPGQTGDQTLARHPKGEHDE